MIVPAATGGGERGLAGEPPIIGAAEFLAAFGIRGFAVRRLAAIGDAAVIPWLVRRPPPRALARRDVLGFGRFRRACTR